MRKKEFVFTCRVTISAVIYSFVQILMAFWYYFLLVCGTSTFFEKQICWCFILLTFKFLKKSAFHPRFRKLFLLGKEFQVDSSFFFYYLNLIVPLHSSMPGFQQKFLPLFCSSMAALNIFHVFTGFKQFRYDILWYKFILVSCAQSQILVSVGLQFTSFLASFAAIISSNSFKKSPSLLWGL